MSDQPTPEERKTALIIADIVTADLHMKDLLPEQTVRTIAFTVRAAVEADRRLRANPQEGEGSEKRFWTTAEMEERVDTAVEEQWDTEEGLSIDCPICQRRAGQKCVIYIKSSISISCSGPDRVEVHSHRQRIAAAIRAEDRDKKDA